MTAYVVTGPAPPFIQGTELTAFNGLALTVRNWLPDSPHRGATDVAAMEEQQKRMKDLAGRFWSKADDERSFIRQTFDSWRIDIGT